MGSQKIETTSNGSSEITSFRVAVVASARMIGPISTTLPKSDQQRLDFGGNGDGQSTAGAPSDTATSDRSGSTGVPSLGVSIEAF
jgi:hypothetical protein